jgi:hypothetical protein
MTETTSQDTSATTTTTTAWAYGATAATAPLEPLQIERRPLGPNDVRIDIKFCGICHTDIHFTGGDWGPVPNPAIPGHEIAGIVTQVGAQVGRYSSRASEAAGSASRTCGAASSSGAARADRRSPRIWCSLGVSCHATVEATQPAGFGNNLACLPNPEGHESIRMARATVHSNIDAQGQPHP